MDVLDQLIELAQLSGSVDTHCIFKGDWKIEDSGRGRGHAQLHLVVQGQAYLQLDQSPPRLLHAGDLIFLPRAQAHQICSSPTFAVDAQALEHTQLGSLSVKKIGSEGGVTELFCGSFRYELESDLMMALPEQLFLNVQHPALVGLSSLLHAEAQAYQQGAHSMINALSTALLTLVMRQYMTQDQALTQRSGVLTASLDRRLYPVIQSVLNAPQEDWSVENLTALAHVSRAQLMRLFKQHVGMSPHGFVQHIRLQKAAKMLRHSSQSILHIALAVGFQSETHFGKAFKQKYQSTPGQYRR